MYRVGDKYILTEIQGFHSGHIYYSESREGMVLSAIVEFNDTEQYITIPKYVFVLTSDSFELYTLDDIEDFDYDIGTTYVFKSSKSVKRMLNYSGIEQYNMYNMMYSDKDKDDNWIDIKQFIDQCTEDDIDI